MTLFVAKRGEEAASPRYRGVERGKENGREAHAESAELEGIF